LHFKLQDPNHTIGLHCQIRSKLGMFVELCVGNCATHDGLFNGANGIFKFVTSLPNNEYLISIQFSNSKRNINTQAKNQHLYLARIEHTWTPIQLISKEIQIVVNSSHLINCIQFPIQTTTTRTIHKSQGLTLDYVAFDSIGTTCHGLTYTSLFQICTKKNPIFISSLAKQ